MVTGIINVYSTSFDLQETVVVNSRRYFKKMFDPRSSYFKHLEIRLGKLDVLTSQRDKFAVSLSIDTQL